MMDADMTDAAATPDPPRDPSSVFVFAGAGLSISPPANLPAFDALRDALLTGMKLRQYIPPRDRHASLTNEQLRVRDIQPEPFFYAFEDAGVDVQSWLNAVLEPAAARSNVAHEVVAELCAVGARVWTVNFDRLIEKAQVPGSPIVPVCAPDQAPTVPGRRGELLKPHGTIGGRLIVTPAETLHPPDRTWQDRLRSDLKACTHAVFIGYSGRDFDFRYLWNEVLTHHTVWWFATSGERNYERRLLRDADREGRLIFPPPQAHPGGDGTTFENPSWDFVKWCEEHQLVGARAPGVRDQLLADRSENDVSGHPPPQATPLARAAIAQLLGDLAGQQAILREAAEDPDHRVEANRRLRNLFLTTPSDRARWVTSLWWSVPPRIGGVDISDPDAADIRSRLRDKHLTQLSAHGDHRAVLALTTRAARRGELTPTAHGLRLTALKMLGHLDAVRELASHAVMTPPRAADTTVRCNAALQWCHALLWAGDLTGLRQVLDEQLRPLARLADTRWMAWADFIEACLYIADGYSDPNVVAQLLDAAAARFSAEANHAGVVDILTVRLTFLRRRGLRREYVVTAAELKRLNARSPLLPFTAQAALLELVQLLGYHLDDAATACRILRDLSKSAFPVHAVAAAVLLGQWETDETHSDHMLKDARRRASTAGLGRLAAFATELLETPVSNRGNVELFYP